MAEDLISIAALGFICLHGEGVEQDYVEAAEWLNKAAHGGDPLAQYNFGLILQYGDGVDQDLEAFEKWLRVAASQGQPDAVRELFDS